MKLSLLLAALLATSTFSFAQNPAAAPAGASETPLQKPLMGRITATSVWQIPATFPATVHKACDSAPPPSFADCFINQMSKSGASPAAVAFTRMLQKRAVAMSAL